ncbi:MAG: hypothetical protein PHV60_09215, partial [bacterium]|nr:hypothetical protein [bacterium]
MYLNTRSIKAMGIYGGIIVSFLCAGVAAWVIARYGQYYKLVDYPSARSSHSQPVPKGGGSGIVLGFMTVALLLGLKLLWWLPAVMIGLLGLVADRTEIAPRARLFLQLLLSLLFLYNFSAKPVNFTLTVLLAVFWSIYLVGTTNIYNFMDGINGIAAITGAIGFLLLGCFTQARSVNEKLPLLLFAVAAACLGFLP